MRSRRPPALPCRRHSAHLRYERADGSCARSRLSAQAARGDESGATRVARLTVFTPTCHQLPLEAGLRHRFGRRLKPSAGAHHPHLGAVLIAHARASRARDDMPPCRRRRSGRAVFGQANLFRGRDFSRTPTRHVNEQGAYRRRYERGVFPWWATPAASTHAQH